MTSGLSIEALQLALHVGNGAQGGDRLITDIGEPGDIQTADFGLVLKHQKEQQTQ